MTNTAAYLAELHPEEAVRHTERGNIVYRPKPILDKNGEI